MAKHRESTHKIERDLSTDDNKRFWQIVDSAASRAPSVVGNKLTYPDAEQGDNNSSSRQPQNDESADKPASRSSSSTSLASF